MGRNIISINNDFGRNIELLLEPESISYKLLPDQTVHFAITGGTVEPAVVLNISEFEGEIVVAIWSDKGDYKALFDEFEDGH
jgi:hypothetical protein